MKRFKGQCKCGECQFLILGSKPKELYDDAVILFNDAQLLWDTPEENINFAKSTRDISLYATCKSCKAHLPIQIGGACVFLPSSLLDEETFNDFKRQIDAVNPRRRAVWMVASFKEDLENNKAAVA